MMRGCTALILLIAGMPVMPADVLARQAEEGGAEPFPGSAVITVDENEYLIRIECRVRGQPGAGFITEPNRITREKTSGRYNAVSVSMRPWQDTGDVVVSFDGYVAWLPAPVSDAGVLSLVLAMSPTTVIRDGAPVLVTYDMWQSGDRPPGREAVRMRVDCASRDPAAPAFRKVGG